VGEDGEMGAQLPSRDLRARADPIVEKASEHVPVILPPGPGSEPDPPESQSMLASSAVTNQHDRLHPAEARMIGLWKRLTIDGNRTAAAMKLAFAVADAMRQRTVLHDPERVRQEFNRNEALKERIRTRDRYTCQWCGAKEVKDVDHIVPVKYGGSNADVNLQVLCHSCNLKKGATCEAIDVVVRMLLGAMRNESVNLKEARRNMKIHGKLWNKNPSTLGVALAAAPFVVNTVVRPAFKKGTGMAVDKLVDREEERQSMIPLLELRKRREEWWQLQPRVRAEILQRDDYRCRACGIKDGPFDVQHAVPLYLGGMNAPENLHTVCFPCGKKRRMEAVRSIGKRVVRHRIGRYKLRKNRSKEDEVMNDEDYFLNPRTGKMEERNRPSPDGRMFTRKHVDSPDDPEFGAINRRGGKPDPEIAAGLAALKRAKAGSLDVDPDEERDHQP